MTRPSFDRSALQRRPRAGRGASRFRGPLLILATSLLATGCDTFTFNPPRPPELAPKAKASGSGDAVRNSGSLKPIEVILMPRIEPDVETLRSTTRAWSARRSCPSWYSASSSGSRCADR